MKFDLEERLISYTASIHEAVELLPDSRGASYLGSQLIRSGTAPALVYGEAMAAESRKDFIHKMKIALKELRESMVCLRIIRLMYCANNRSNVDHLLLENTELISIFVKSIQTAQANLTKLSRK